MHIIELQSVQKDYPSDAGNVHALRGVDLTIEAGDFAAIVGPSGSGKSTLLHMISGLDSPTSGRVLVAGQDIMRMSATELSRLRLEKIGFVFQAYNLVPVLTAYENVEYIMLLQGRPRAERQRRAMEMLHLVGLHGMEKRFPRELSGGQQQRVAVARAIAAEPALVLADEPTANLDSTTAADLISVLERLNREQGVTFVFSTHDSAVTARARRRIALRDGRVLDREADTSTSDTHDLQARSVTSSA